MTITAAMMTTTIAPLLLESSELAVVAGDAGDDSASGAGTRRGIGFFGRGRQFGRVGGPSVTLIVGATNSGSAAPSTGISIQAISPVWQVSMAGKWMSPA